MKSVLYIGAGVPWQGGAGFLVRQRMHLRALAEVAELHLAMFDWPQEGDSNRPAYIKSLTPVPRIPRTKPGGLGQLAADLFSPLPRMVRAARPAAARQTVAGLHPLDFDAVFAFRIDFAHFAGVLGHPRLLLDIDDPEHLRWRRQLATTGGGDWRTRHDLQKLARFEKHAVRGALASFVCQENDRSAFDPPPLVIPNCVDVPPIRPGRASSSPRIVLVGNFNAASPNVDALRWFLDDIWTRIRAEVSDAEFHVIGRVRAELEARIGATPGAVAAGFVADLPAAMAQASLSIAPIRFGTGTRVKIIESFALGCPVVSTTLGAEGIDAEPGRDIYIGDTASEFAKRCVALLRDANAQERVAAAAYEIAASRYNEARRRGELIETLQRLLMSAKSEIRNSKSETNPRRKEENPKQELAITPKG